MHVPIEDMRNSRKGLVEADDGMVVRRFVNDFNASPVQDGENNGGLLPEVMMQTSLARPEIMLLLGAGIGLAFSLLLLWGTTACIDEPVADLRAVSMILKKIFEAR